MNWTPEMKSELDFAIEYYETSCIKEVAEFERDCIAEYERKIKLLREGIESRASTTNEY